MWNGFALCSHLRVKDRGGGCASYRDFGVAKTSARKAETKKRQVDNKKNKLAGKGSAAKSTGSRSSASKATAKTPAVKKAPAIKAAAKKSLASKAKAPLVAPRKMPEVVSSLSTAPETKPPVNVAIVPARPKETLSIKKVLPGRAIAEDVSVAASSPSAARSSVAPSPAKAMALKPRADMPPEQGFSVMVDGHHKTLHDNKAGAMADAMALKQRFPFLRIEIFDASQKTRANVG